MFLQKVEFSEIKLSETVERSMNIQRLFSALIFGICIQIFRLGGVLGIFRDFGAGLMDTVGPTILVFLRGYW